MNNLRTNPDNISGFSLIELMIVVAIIGVITTIALPAYNGYIETSKIGVALANAETLAGFEDNYFYENDSYLAGTYVPGTNGLAALDWAPSGDNDKFKYEVTAGTACGSDITKCYTVTVSYIEDPSLTATVSRP